MSTEYYSDIPASLLQNKVILEVGAGSGKNQLRSRHKKLFEIANKYGYYLGLDNEPQEQRLLHIMEADIRDFTVFWRSVDTVLLMHCLEHIPIEDWPSVFAKLKEALRDGGVLVIACPYDEDPLRPRDQFHVVFNITLTTLEKYLPGIRMFKANIKYPKRGNVRKMIWWLRQFFNGRRFVPLGLTRYSFIAFWRKEARS